MASPNRIRRSLGTVLPLLALFPSACREELADNWNGTIDTLTGGMLVILNPPVGLWRDQPPWHLAEDLWIGSVEGDGPQTFADLVDMEVDATGRIYVLDRQAQEIRVFDTAGAYVRTIGRPGAGPGEFLAATGMAFDLSGQLWVANQGNLRYSVFDSAGGLVTELPRRMGVRVTEWAGVFDASGALFDVVFFRTPAGAFFEYRRYDTTTGEFAEAAGGPGFPGAPLGLGVRLATQDGWWLGAGNQYRLHFTTRDGDTVRIIAREMNPSEEAATNESPIAGNGSQRLPGSRDTLLRSLDRARQERLILTLVQDEYGYLWVVLSPRRGIAGNPIDIFDPRGRYLGMLRSPVRIERTPAPLVHRGRLYVVRKNQLDVPFVVRMKVTGYPHGRP